MNWRFIKIRQSLKENYILLQINLLNSILVKLYVSDQEAAEKKIADLDAEVQTLNGKVETLTEGKIQQSSGN